MSSLPIACTLSATDLDAVKKRYLDAASQYWATARISPAQADITLNGNKAAIDDFLAEMIERESTCCAFLHFDVTETTDGFNVRLRMVDASRFDRDILRESVTAFFPTAMIVNSPG